MVWFVSFSFWLSSMQAKQAKDNGITTEGGAEVDRKTGYCGNAGRDPGKNRQAKTDLSKEQKVNQPEYLLKPFST